MAALLRILFHVTALGLALALGLSLGLSALGAQDPPWAHLALGRLLAEAGRLPLTDPLLFGAPTPFHAGSWAYDLLAFQLQKAAGLPSLRALDAVLYAVALGALLGACFRRGARPFSSALLLLALGFAVRPDLSPGPGLLAWALFCVALWLLEGPFWPSFFNRWVWLPPLAALGVNLHPAAWALAPLGLIWMLNEGAAREAEAASQPRLAKAFFALALVGCLSLHPQGPRSLGFAWGQLAPPPWLPDAFAARQGGLLLLLLAAALWAAAALGAAQGRRGRDGWLLAAFGLAALASRNALPYALALAVPMAAFRFDALVDALPGPLRRARWPLKLALLPALALLAWRAGALPGRAEAPAPGYPLQSRAFYERELLDLNILSPKAWSDRLAFELVPHARFAWDSRGVQGRVAEARVAGILDAQEGWSQALDEAQVEACWLPRGSLLAQALSRALAWQPLSFDNASVLYVRDWAPTKELVRVHAPRGLRPGDPQHPLEPSRLAQAEADLEAALARDPKLGVLYLYQAELWLAKGAEARARQALEAGIQADPDFADHYARLAELRAKRGDLEGARQAYQHALRRKALPAWARALEAL